MSDTITAITLSRVENSVIFIRTKTGHRVVIACKLSSIEFNALNSITWDAYCAYNNSIRVLW